MSLGSVVLKLTTNPKMEAGATSGTGTFATDTGRGANVRRPVRGIVLRTDTFGQLAVIDINGGNSDVLYSSSTVGGTTTWTADLLVQSISVSRSEKFQPLPTFGSAYGYFFGENHTFVNVSAVLMDTADFPWKRDWWANYEESMRGTQLVEARRRIVFSCNDTLFEGYIIQSSTSEGSGEQGFVQMSFQMWATSIIYNGQPGDGTLPRSASSGSEYLPTVIAPHRTSTQPVTDASPGGLFGALQHIADGIAEVKNWVGDRVEDMENFLYGRNIVIPAGSMSAASLSTNEYNAARSHILSLSIPTQWQRARQEAAKYATGQTWENWDEYVENPPVEKDLSTGILADSQTDIASFVGYDLSAYLQMTADMQAEVSMKQINPKWTVTEGYRTTELMRVLGRATFRALSLTASYTRADVVLARMASGVTPLESESVALTPAEARTRAVNLSATTRMRAPGVVWPAQ